MTSRDHKWDFLRFWVQTLLNHLTFVWCTANRMQLLCKKTQTGLTGWLMESFIFISFARHCNHYSCFVRNRMRYKQFPNQSLSSATQSLRALDATKGTVLSALLKWKLLLIWTKKLKWKTQRLENRAGRIWLTSAFSFCQVEKTAEFGVYKMLGLYVG